MAKANPKLRLLGLDITAEALVATVQDPDEPDRVVTWRVSQPTCYESVLGDIAVRGRSSEPTLYSGSLDENLFELEPAALARLPALAAAALALARLQELVAMRGAHRRSPVPGIAPARIRKR